ncbi:MAG TPA: hypothetical protein VGJ30_08595, partial [Candidatus Angelobacter sp.]
FADSAPDAQDLCREGASKAISLFMDDSCNQPRTPLFPSNQSTFTWAYSALQHSGRIAICEKLLDYQKAGLADIAVMDDEIRVEFLPRYSGLENIDTEEFEWLTDSIHDGQQTVRKALGSIQPKIHEIMRPLVYRWIDYYIGYEADPLVDAYFERLGVLTAELMTGHDAFEDEANFGGLPFAFYRATVWTLVGWAIKHVNFAKLLQEKHPDLLPQNLTTVTADIDKLSSSLAAALGATVDDASRALSLLELNLHNVTALCINGHAPPPLIRSSSEQFIRPLSGMLVTPFHFMLRNLRANYRQDWDRALNTRESLFRDELLQLFPQSWLRKLTGSVALNQGEKTLTDIDAVIVDTKNGTVGLFQLKWQEPFGHSIRERSARMDNFNREAVLWIDTVTNYLATHTSEEMGSKFGVSKKSYRDVEYYLFVVGRYFTHFSGDEMPDPRAAWGVWPHLIRLIRATAASENPIKDLHVALVKDSPALRPLSIPSSSFKIGGKTVRMMEVPKD